MKTEQWIKKLGGHAGELYVAAELSKRGIPNSLLPEKFSDDDILIGRKDGNLAGYVQVKSCHPDRAKSFILRENNEAWANAEDNQFVVFVWLGSPKKKSDSPRYWIARKKDVGLACTKHPAHGSTTNWERRFYLRNPDPLKNLDPTWESNWDLFKDYLPGRG